LKIVLTSFGNLSKYKMHINSINNRTVYGAVNSIYLHTC
jgi:hypothetical protein